MHNPIPSAPVESTPIEPSPFTLTVRPALDAPLVTRRELRRRHRQAKRRATFAPIAGVAAAGALIAVATFAHPAVANAETPAGSNVSTTARVTVSAKTAAGAELLFTRTAERADDRAATAVATASAVLDSARGKVDGAPLAGTIAALSNYRYLDTTTVQSLTNAAVAATTDAQAQVAAVDKAAADAAAAEAAAAAAAAAAEEAAAAAAAQALADRVATAATPDGARTVAAALAAESYGWGDAQFQCLDSLWTKESGWNYQAENASSGAFGIPQSLPGSKMATVADDWATNGVTQITWGLDYIARGYGTPCAAWSHSQSVNWY
jgi:hypothetical protein